MEKNRKIYIQIGLIYGGIISLLNYLGYLLPSTGKFPTKKNPDYEVWMQFIETHSKLVNTLGALGFIIPVCLCLYYTWVCKSENLKKRIINLPLAFSLFGASGWFFSMLFELIVLWIVKFQMNISILELTLSSFLNIVQASLFIFTMSFLILYTVQRKYVLPKVFPDENISIMKGIVKPSMRFLFTVLYLSVGIFPIFYLFSCLYNASSLHNFTIDSGVYIVVACLVICGIIIILTFSNFFSYPLRKLQEGAEKIKEGDYSHKVEVVTNDSFGELTYTFNEMTSALNEKTKKILEFQDSVIRGMAVMVESRDNSTGGHINRTSDCVKVFVDKLKQTPEYGNLDDNFYQYVIKAAPMHDLGKIAVDDAILRKPGKFTPEEYEVMKKHSAEGARIVENVLQNVDDYEFKTIAINVAHYHHEKWDGSGYPEKIAGDAIPFEARIMALADVFDALVSKRCYKDSFTYDKAFQIIEESLGTHFDPELGRLFIKCRDELEELYNSY